MRLITYEHERGAKEQHKQVVCRPIPKVALLEHATVPHPVKQVSLLVSRLCANGNVHEEQVKDNVDPQCAEEEKVCEQPPELEPIVSPS